MVKTEKTNIILTYLSIPVTIFQMWYFVMSFTVLQSLPDTPFKQIEIYSFFGFCYTVSWNLFIGAQMIFPIAIFWCLVILELQLNRIFKKDYSWVN